MHLISTGGIEQYSVVEVALDGWGDQCYQLHSTLAATTSIFPHYTTKYKHWQFTYYKIFKAAVLLQQLHTVSLDANKI